MLSTCLANLRKILVTSPQKKFTLATGNQSGDLDSVVCAIVHSFFHNILHSKLTDHNSTLMVPFLNFYKKDLRLRKDVLLALQMANVDPDSLFFVDDLKDGSALLNSVKDIMLVDHNTPQGHVAIALSQVPVIGIIDHHEDEGKFMDVSPRVLVKTGSCSSLVWGYWLDRTKYLLDELNDEEIKDVIKLLSAALLLDTSNCTSKMIKDDWDALESYKELSGADIGTQSLDGWYQKLQDARNDIHGLTIGEILIKDYKVFECPIGTTDTVLNLGISSMIKSFDWLLQHEEDQALDAFQQQAQQFIIENNIDALLVMAAFVNPVTLEFQRQLVFFTMKEEVSILLRLVISSISEELQLHELPLDRNGENDTPFIKFYNQGNVKGSRKIVAPVIKTAVRNL